ncbi:Cytochrome P450 monooxygenase cicH [Cladobotryum mycophilum]|uniref:Cytochrome P450 monooxygenase cicH n=1 Tax=Cladobotryum mycophilum TaxID=491253 RepID=A0ABR0SQ45_9HYPO
MEHSSEAFIHGSKLLLESRSDILVFSIIILFGSTILYYVRQVFRSDLRSVPGPALAPWTALYRPWMISDGLAHNFYRKLHSRYGPIVRTAPNVVSVSDPRAIPAIYAIGTKFYKANLFPHQATSSFYSVFDVEYRGGLMTSMFSSRDPARHQSLRRPVAQKFSMSSMKALEPFADDCAEIFIRAMTEMEGQSIDLGEWLQWYAFDVISAITFQRRLGFMEKQEDIEHMIEDIGNGFKFATLAGQISLTPLWLLIKARELTAKFVPSVRSRNPLKTVVQFTEECINEYDQNPPGGDRPDFLGWLRKANTNGDFMPYPDLVNHLSNNFLAGSDTTAISLRAILYYLTRDPICYRKAQEEVDQADRDGMLSENITYAECLRLPYLQASMKEAMRCHPGVSFPLERVVPAGGADICGVRLRPGTIVGINPVVIHHDKSIFGEDATDFNPDRWLGSDHERIKYMDRHLFTFGYGSRSCIGKNISIMEMGKLIPQILRHFHLEWASTDKTWRVSNFWFARQEGLIFRLRVRDKTV